MSRAGAVFELRQGRGVCPHLGISGRADSQWVFERHSSFAPDAFLTPGG